MDVHVQEGTTGCKSHYYAHIAIGSRPSRSAQQEITRPTSLPSSALQGSKGDLRQATHMPVPAIEHGIRRMSHGQGSHSDSIKRDTLGLPAPVGMRHDNTPHTWHHALQPVTQANGKWLTSQWQLQKMLCHNQRAVFARAHRPLLPPTGQCVGRVCPFLSGPHGSRNVAPFAACTTKGQLCSACLVPPASAQHRETDQTTHRGTQPAALINQPFHGVMSAASAAW
jgi:hypothetical protein